MSAPVTKAPSAIPALQTTTQQPFKDLLRDAKQTASTALPPGLARRPVGSSAPQRATAITPPATTVKSQAVAQSQTVAVGRSRVQTEAARLQTVRAHHVANAETSLQARVDLNLQHEAQTQARIVDLIVKDLVAEFQAQPPSSKLANPLQPVSTPADLPVPVGAATAGAGNAQPSPLPPTPQVKAAQAAALIERIEVFVRSQRPALALTLNNSLGARVEIERLGKGEVALRLIGQNGPPSPEAVSRIREELTARGLKVGALSVA
jgi:hypothetical protein